MSRLAVLLALAACTLRPYDFEASATDVTTSTSNTTDPATGPASTTTEPPPTTTAGSTIEATSTSTTTTGGSFVHMRDGGPGKECDIWNEDCPDGQKCMPYSGDGDNAWESLKCVPIDPDPDTVGEPCMVFGRGVSGEDTCELHAICFNVDPDTGIGTCLAMCTGSPDDPTCEDPDSTCGLSSDGVLNLCLEGCDPLAQDCDDGHMCVQNPWNPDGFMCVLDASGEEGQAFDVCEHLHTCDPGLLCANPPLAVECDPMALGCCLPFCDASAPPDCPGKDQQCLPWFEDGQAPPGLENVGVCGLPQ